ncbi:MAG: adenine-specific methyltransferase EcoRI family protein [Armatimonadetes bacterium]|nr:adenine-specific methyltransferase EcoRI family protein [Armatimonadota bacterium]
MRTAVHAGNRTLSNAKAAKQDEFYTQYDDIQKEIEAYLEYDPDTFRGKVVYCNCDDPYESNFFKYFAANFNRLGLKRLITTSYDGSPIAGQGVLFPEYDADNGNRPRPKALAVVIDRVQDEDGDGAVSIADVEVFLKTNNAARIPLKGNAAYPGGDFRSPECIEFLKQADIVVTNPPFSLFREYVAQLVEHGKKFLIIGNKNAITYKEIFPLIKENKIWLGVTPMGTDLLFDVPPQVAEAMLQSGKEGSNYKIVNGKVMGRSTAVWFTNLDHGRRHQELQLMTMADNLRYNKKLRGTMAYQRYDNYDAIEVPFTEAIPSDYDGAMGVPITFLDKYNPEQFEILNANDFRTNPNTPIKPHGLIKDKDSAINGKPTYVRILIRHRRKSAQEGAR